MQVVINIPDEQIKKSLEESKYIHEDEGEKGSVHIAMLYTNGQLDFINVSRKTDFYSCEYKVLPKGHRKIVDSKEVYKFARKKFPHMNYDDCLCRRAIATALRYTTAIIEADEVEE
jgi:hypothetical protein